MLGIQDSGVKYVTSNLWVDYDIAQRRIYPTTGTTVNNSLTTNGAFSGTTINGPTYDSDRGGSLVFDGTNDYVELNGTGTKQFPNGITVECWVRAGYTFLGQINWAGVGGISQGSGWTDGWGMGWANSNIYNTNQSLFFWISQGKGATPNIALFTGGTYTSGTIYHIVGTYDGTTIRVYRDGVLGFQTFTFTGTWQYPSDPRPIQIMKIEGGNEWNGNLYILRIYERALSQTEITQNFNALRSRFSL